MEFKERLKTLRKQKGITQSDLAGILNYGYTAVSNYESGRNEPSIKDLKKIAEFFDVSMDYLLCVNDIKNPYVVSSDKEPDEEFLQKYSYLSSEGKNQLNSLLDWMISQHPELMTGSKPVLEAAQEEEKYEASETEN
ncbi:MAG: helix-turn-helix domain-containing protein [Lachnospiraceae bacterium]|nr:helix-turn-helix domain-containing protein [Lachnospiraceae bacterium]